MTEQQTPPPGATTPAGDAGPSPKRTRSADALALLRTFTVRRNRRGAAFAIVDGSPAPLKPYAMTRFAELYNDVLPAAMFQNALASLGRLDPLEEDGHAGNTSHLPLDPLDRPSILIGPELHENVRDAVSALATDPDIFHRNAELVHVVPVDADITEGGTTWAAGTPQVRALPVATLRVRLSLAARWLTEDRRARQIVQTHPSGHVVDAVHAQGEWPGLRPLVGVLETPSFRPDGSMIETPGYDAATGYLYQPNCTVLPVPKAPTQAHAAKALADLREVFIDFPYAGSAGAGAEVPIAAILTLMTRPMIAGATPVFLFDATTPGSGKSLQTDLVALIASGRRAPRMSWPASEEEVEKVVSGFAMCGAASIAFDNVKRPFGGGAIERVATATDRVALRVLGFTEMREIRWRAVIMASGNNLAVEGETIRRCILCRLEPQCERPEERAAFKHPDILAWVALARPRLVAAACTMVAAWVHAGRPLPIKTSWGSFQEWTDIIPQVIAFAGGGDVTNARLALREEGHDSESTALAAIMSAIGRLDTGSGINAKGLVGALYPTRDPHDRRPQGLDGFDDARDAVETFVRVKPGMPPSPQLVGIALAKFKGRVVGGKFLALVPPDRSKSNAWEVRTP